jgi:hypothetical protein
VHRRIVSLFVSLAIFVAAAGPARAEELATGRTCAVSISGLPGQLSDCQGFGLTVGVELFDDGTSRRRPCR